MRSVVSLHPLSSSCRMAADPSHNSLRSREDPLPLLRPFPELPQPFAGAEEDLVEALRLDFEMRADFLLALVREVEAEEDLAVAVVAQLVEEPLHLAGLLTGQDLVERGGATVGEGGHGTGPLLVLTAIVERAVACLFAPVGDEEIARRAANETGKPFGFPHLGAANLFEHQRQSLLVKIVRQGRILSEAAEHQEETVAEARHQLRLGGAIARLNPCDQPGGIILRWAGAVQSGEGPDDERTKNTNRLGPEEREHLGSVEEYTDPKGSGATAATIPPCSPRRRRTRSTN